MNVKLPNGIILKDVPNNLNSDEIKNGAIEKGLATEDSFNVDSNEVLTPPQNDLYTVSLPKKSINTEYDVAYALSKNMFNKKDFFNEAIYNPLGYLNVFNGEDISLEDGYKKIKDLNNLTSLKKPTEVVEYSLNKYGGLSQEETKNLIPSVDEFMNPPSDNDNPFEYNDSKVISYDDYKKIQPFIEQLNTLPTDFNVSNIEESMEFYIPNFKEYDNLPIEEQESIDNLYDRILEVVNGDTTPNDFQNFLMNGLTDDQEIKDIYNRFNYNQGSFLYSYESWTKEEQDLFNASENFRTIPTTAFVRGVTDTMTPDFLLDLVIPRYNNKTGSEVYRDVASELEGFVYKTIGFGDGELRPVFGSIGEEFTYKPGQQSMMQFYESAGNMYGTISNYALFGSILRATTKGQGLLMSNPQINQWVSKNIPTGMLRFFRNATDNLASFNAAGQLYMEIDTPIQDRMDQAFVDSSYAIAFAGGDQVAAIKNLNKAATPIGATTVFGISLGANQYQDSESFELNLAGATLITFMWLLGNGMNTRVAKQIVKEQFKQTGIDKILKAGNSNYDYNKFIDRLTTPGKSFKFEAKKVPEKVIDKNGKITTEFVDKTFTIKPTLPNGQTLNNNAQMRAYANEWVGKMMMNANKIPYSGKVGVPKDFFNSPKQIDTNSKLGQAQQNIRKYQSDEPFIKEERSAKPIRGGE